MSAVASNTCHSLAMQLGMGSNQHVRMLMINDHSTDAQWREKEHRQVRISMGWMVTTLASAVRVGRGGLGRASPLVFHVSRFICDSCMRERDESE